MSKFIVLILVFLIVIIFALKFCLSLIKGSAKIFKMGDYNDRNSKRQNNKYYHKNYESQSTNSNTGKKFSKDEGKYVDYEEIKEENY